jgi:hypothetical protein
MLNFKVSKLRGPRTNPESCAGDSTVTIFPKFNPDVLGLRGKHSHLSVDCTSPTV